MTQPSFKKTLSASLIGHMVVLSLFSFSFGKAIPLLHSAPVSFWGQVLHASNLAGNKIFSREKTGSAWMRNSPRLGLPKVDTSIGSSAHYYFKPHLKLPAWEKQTFMYTYGFTHPAQRSQSVVMLYPILPEHFLLYFKDRQVVHMEIAFNIYSNGPVNSVIMKRKISSGNLEADLLAMRYLGHYLFIQQKAFLPNQWQSVKIELSEKRGEAK